MNAELARLRAAVADYFAATDAKTALELGNRLRTMIARRIKPPVWEVLDDESECLDMEGYSLQRRTTKLGDVEWSIRTPDDVLLGTLRPEDPPQSVCDGADECRAEYRRLVGERTEPEDRVGADR